MWIEVAIAIALTGLGVIVSIVVALKQTSEARIEMTKLSNFLIDTRGETLHRFSRIEQALTDI